MAEVKIHDPGDHEPPQRCPPGYHWDPRNELCVPNVTPPPPPPPNPQPTRLGNPSVSDQISFVYSMPSTPPPPPPPPPPAALTGKIDKTTFARGDTYTISGTGNPGDRVHITFDFSPLQDGDVTIAADGTYSFSEKWIDTPNQYQLIILDLTTGQQVGPINITVTPSVSSLIAEPLPPIPDGEPTTLALKSDKQNYVFGKDKAIITARPFFTKDGTPLAGRRVPIAIAGEIYTPRTSPDGVATIIWTPFGVPDPSHGDPTTRRYFAQAVFLGY